MIQSVTLINVVNGSSFVFNDDNCPLNMWTMDVDIRSEDRERPLEHGLYSTYAYYGRRIFHGEGALMGNDPTSYMRLRLDLHNALALPKRKGIRTPFQLQIRFAGISELLTSFVTLDSFPELPISAEQWTVTDFLLSLKAFDPLLYGTHTFSATAGTPGTITGARFPLDFPIVFSSSTSGGDILATNGGNVDVAPAAIIRGPVTNPKLTLVDTGESFRMDGLILPVGESVTVDFFRHTALTSSNQNAYPYVTDDSSWWQLAPGDNTVRFTADRASSPANATIQWNNAYML